MAFSYMLQKLKRISALVTFLAVLMLPSTVIASTYGSGSYSNCPYGDSCASSGGTSSGSSSSGGSSSSTSSSGSGTSTTSSSGNQILLNDFDEYFASDGKQVDLKTKQVVYFELIENGKTNKHSVTITSVGKNYVDITIASDSITDRLYIGDVNKYDVNSDGVDDIEITLNSITNGVASLNFKSLTAATNKPNTKPTNSVISGGQTTWRSKLPFILFALLAILGIGMFILLAIRRRKKKQLFK